MSTNPDRLDDVKVGVLCYLHLWAALHKHVKLNHRDIGNDIGLWEDQQGSYFAAYNQGNRRTLQINVSYVCALGDEGPAVGQLSKIPPCNPVQIAPDVLALLNTLAESEGKATDTALKQIDLIAELIEKEMPASRKRASLN